MSYLEIILIFVVTAYPVAGIYFFAGDEDSDLDQWLDYGEEDEVIEGGLIEWILWETAYTDSFFPFLLAMVFVVSVMFLFLPFGWILAVGCEIIFGYRFVMWRKNIRRSSASVRKYK